jgi:hypothetical protein
VRDHYNNTIKPQRQLLGEGLVVVQNDDEPEHMRNVSSNFVVVVDQASLDSINNGPDAIFELPRSVNQLTATEGELATFVRLVDITYAGTPVQLGTRARGRESLGTPGARFWEGWMTITPRSLMHVARWEPDFETMFFKDKSKDEVYDMYD